MNKQREQQEVSSISCTLSLAVSHFETQNTGVTLLPLLRPLKQRGEKGEWITGLETYKVSWHS